MSDDTDTEESTVHYALLIYTDPHAQDGDTDEQREAVTAEYWAIRATGRALDIADGLAADLDGYQYLHSTRAELLRRLGRTEEARAAYEHALELTRAEPERRFLERRLADL